MGSSLSTMNYLAVLAIISVSCVLGKDSLTHHKYGDGDVISQNLTAVWEAIHHLEHQIHDLQDHPAGHGQNRGGSHSQNEHHELMSLIHEVGIRRFDDKYYMTEIINSSTQVKSQRDNEDRPAFGVAHFMYMRGHSTGLPFSNYRHDSICTWNAGGSVAVHMIHPDGTHERKVLGDVQHDHHAQYVVTIPGGSWESTELIEGEYALITFVMAPAIDYANFLPYNVDTLSKQYPQYEKMIRRLDRIHANDTPLDIEAQASHDHEGHQGHDHHDQNHDEHHDDHGSRHGLIGRNDGHDRYGNQGYRQNSHYDDHHDDHYQRGYDNHNDRRGYYNDRRDYHHDRRDYGRRDYQSDRRDYGRRDFHNDRRDYHNDHHDNHNDRYDNHNDHYDNHYDHHDNHNDHHNDRRQNP